MQTLESYLSDGIQRDREDIAAIDRVLAETGKTITETFDPNCKNWPYEIPDLRTDKTHISHSTMTMMIRAIDLLRESKREGAARPAYAFDIGKPYRVTLDKARNEAFETLAARLKGDDTQPNTDEVRKITYSPSYGTNDPLTLSFLAEVLSATSGDTDDLSAHAKAVVKKLTEIDPVNGFADFFKNDTETKSKTVANAFVPLLAVRAAQSLKQETFEKRATYLRYFESTLHDQLSYSHIPDSRFDPAELIFSLEGVLRLSEQTIDVRLFDRILDVLEQAQSTSAHWRPSKPFLRTEKGFALFPISVEAANSLLWCCERPDRDEPFHSRSERYIALFRRFWNWLAARRVTVPVNKGSQSRVSGWHSDHVADPNSVQLWDTAQVVAFLLGYRRSLYNHIARTTLRLSRFDVRRPERAEQSWSSQTQDGQRARATVTAEAADDKVSLRADFEPVKQLGPYFETYRKVEQEFLIPWLEGIPRSYSMLLYGPPGTGKTSVAKNLANALGFSLITITVSDFLAGGGGEVEARAKMIFEVLEAQANVVILFDEIDELVLDRSSKRHGQQETVFKFMTPGMLTKLNNLRGAKRCIFIMATNYAYRIDPAIRRTGRIDENYLLLPPDSESRQRMIKEFLGKQNLSPEHSLHPDQIERGNLWEPLKKASFFLGYKDIEAAVARVMRRTSSKQSAEELERELRDWGRTTTLRLYNGAFDETDDYDAIKREFFPLVEMAAREGMFLEGRLKLENKPLFTADKNTGRPAVFASDIELQEEASNFVKGRGPE